MRKQIGFIALRYFAWLIVPLLYWRDLHWGRRHVGRAGCSMQTGVNASATTDLHIVIATPKSEHDAPNCKPGGGNYFFELSQSAIERFGPAAVSTFVIDTLLPLVTWQNALIEHLQATNATHCVAFVESDPGTAGPWHWNEFGARCHKRWNGTLVGILTDGIYLLHQVRAARLRNVFPDSVFVAIDMTPQAHASFVPAGIIGGPCFLPISKASIEALGRVGDLGRNDREFDLVFVGKVYENREAFLHTLTDSGLRVGINPHRSHAKSRPGYDSYVSALRRGYFTINLSEAGGMPVAQLKSRMLEGPLFGTIVCSDESELAAHYFAPDEFITFNSATSLEDAVRPLLMDHQARSRMINAAHLRASAIAANSFWDSANETLIANDKRRLGF